MTREEAKKLLMLMQAAYPNFSPPDKTAAVGLWHSMLEDMPYALAEAALRLYIRTDRSGFAPSVGQVIGKAEAIAGGGEPDGMEAWGMVLRAVRNSCYHAEEEFAKLPPAAQRAVGSPGQLREWALAEDADGSAMSVARSHFINAYRQSAERERDMRLMPPDLLALVRGALEGGGGVG